MAIVEVVRRDRVVSVQKVTRHGSSCLCLGLESGQKKHLNLNVFISNSADLNAVLKKFEQLIGKEVKIFCWDPDRQPGKWSNEDWFKEIAVISDDEQIAMNIKDKGHCDICGIADGLLNRSHDHGKSWWHAACRTAQ